MPLFFLNTGQQKNDTEVFCFRYFKSKIGELDEAEDTDNESVVSFAPAFLFITSFQREKNSFQVEIQLDLSKLRERMNAQKEKESESPEEVYFFCI